MLVLGVRSIFHNGFAKGAISSNSSSRYSLAARRAFLFPPQTRSLKSLVFKTPPRLTWTCHPWVLVESMRLMFLTDCLFLTRVGFLAARFCFVFFGATWFGWFGWFCFHARAREWLDNGRTEIVENILLETQSVSQRLVYVHVFSGSKRVGRKLIGAKKTESNKIAFVRRIFLSSNDGGYGNVCPN